MTTNDTPSDSKCGGCTCGCSAAGDQAPADGLTGWRLVFAAVLAFLLPLALGITGAAVLAPVVWQQVLGCLGGLGVGILIAVAASRLTTDRGEAR